MLKEKKEIKMTPSPKKKFSFKNEVQKINK